MKTTEIDDIDLDAVMQARREKLLNDQATKQQELEGIETQLRRIEAYLNTGAAPAESKPVRKATSTRTPQGKLPPLQERILAIVKRYLPDGVKTESITDELEARTGDEKRPVYAALDRMKKGGLIEQAGKRQPYTLGANAPTGTPAQREIFEPPGGEVTPAT
jgi:hypothetical protein